MENFNKVLEKILLSKNASAKFYEAYNNPEFFNQINSILPEVEKCRVQTQRGPWHIYNVLDHILKAVENMNVLSKDLSKSDRKLLCFTMFFHDIGKPDCHREYVLDGEIRDGFHGHNLESMKILERVKDKLELSSKEYSQMLWLIKNHDIFSDFIGSPKQFYESIPLDMNMVIALIKDADKAGDGVDLVQKLSLVGRADNYSQNRSMTRETLEKIKTYESIACKIKVKE